MIYIYNTKKKYEFWNLISNLYEQAEFAFVNYLFIILSIYESLSERLSFCVFNLTFS